jgi:hypothetical protein
MIDPIDIEQRFWPHRLSQEQHNRLKSIRTLAEALANAIVDLTPTGREQSLALTQLETASFWAAAAIARESTHLATAVESDTTD